MKALCSFLLAVLCATTVTAINVEIIGRRIFIDGRHVFIKGINYSPAPIGRGSWYDSHSVPAIFNRDLPKISAIGANAIRVYGFQWFSNYSKYEPFLDACKNHGLYVALGFGVPSSLNFDDPESVRLTLDKFSRFIGKYKDHPAIFMWLVGNEINHNKTHNLDSVFAFIRQARDVAHLLDTRPVSTAISDQSDIFALIQKYDDAVDIWSTQLYRGRTFGNFWKKYVVSSGKPSLMTEFGCDAFNNGTQREDQPTQAVFDKRLMRELAHNCDVSSGGFVFGYVDQWWKGGGNSSEHSSAGRPSHNPDAVSNEAWYGMFSAALNPIAGEPDLLTPRMVCSEFTKVWGNFTCEKEPAKFR